MPHQSWPASAEGVIYTEFLSAWGGLTEIPGRLQLGCLTPAPASLLYRY